MPEPAPVPFIVPEKALHPADAKAFPLPLTNAHKNTMQLAPASAILRNPNKKIPQSRE
jgi:hypothetical protein